MKKVFIFGLIFTFFTSCDKNRNKVTESLSSINIIGASSIYEKSSSATKSDTDGTSTFWKVDASGVETELKIFDNNGSISDAKITAMLKLTNNILMLEAKQGTNTTLTLFADITTNKLYLVPEGIDLRVNNYGQPQNAQLDINGMIYLKDKNSEATNYSQIYQLDPNNFTLKPMLANNQSPSDFAVFENGFIFYLDKIQTPGGKVIVLERGNINQDPSDLFVFNKKLFSYEQDLNIYEWYKIDDNNLGKRVISDFYYYRNNKKEMYSMSFPFYNPIKNVSIITTVERVGQSDPWNDDIINLVFEFDGKSAPKEITEGLQIQKQYLGYQQTSDAVWS